MTQLLTNLMALRAITQRVVVTPYRRFGTTYLSHFQPLSSLDCLTSEDGTERLFRSVGILLYFFLNGTDRLSRNVDDVTTNLRRFSRVKQFGTYCLILEDVTYRSSRNVGN